MVDYPWISHVRKFDGVCHYFIKYRRMLSNIVAISWTLHWGNAIKNNPSRFYSLIRFVGWNLSLYGKNVFWWTKFANIWICANLLSANYFVCRKFCPIRCQYVWPWIMNPILLQHVAWGFKNCTMKILERKANNNILTLKFKTTCDHIKTFCFTVRWEADYNATYAHTHIRIYGPRTSSPRVVSLSLCL